MRRRRALGERHIRILDFIEAYIEENGYPPSHREIGNAVSIPSSASVAYYLDQLQKYGYIEIDRTISRGLRLRNKSASYSETVKIPILSRIAAGKPIPIPASEFNFFDHESSIELPISLLPSRMHKSGLYALEVQGNSMVDALIGDGDIVIMKPIGSEKEDQIRNGDMAAIWLPEEEETTLKYFYKEADRYRLQPANPTMKPIYISKSQPLEIKSKVVMVIRSTRASFPFQYSDRIEYLHEEDTSQIILENSRKPSRPLTPDVLAQEVLPYLKAIETIQWGLDVSEKRKTKKVVRIRSISQHSPESITLDGVTRAIEFIINRLDPNRRKLVELNEEQMKLQNRKIKLEADGVEIENRRKKYDLLEDLLEHHVDSLTNEQKDRIIPAMILIAVSDIRMRKGYSSADNIRDRTANYLQ